MQNELDIDYSYKLIAGPETLTTSNRDIAVDAFSVAVKYYGADNCEFITFFRGSPVPTLLTEQAG